MSHVCLVICQGNKETMVIGSRQFLTRTLLIVLKNGKKLLMVKFK